MRAKRPKHRTDVIVRIARDRNAPDDDDAAPFLDLVENPRELGIERPVPAMLRQDLAEPEPCLRNRTNSSSRAVACRRVRSKAISSFLRSAPRQAIG
jgi:hypothetical protein